MPANLSTRIKTIQKQIRVAQTGTIDLPTCNVLEQKLGIVQKGSSLTVHTKAIQQYLNINADGIIGPVTVSRIETFISRLLPAIPAGASMIVSYTALNTLIQTEVSSEKLYNQKYQSPIWVGGDSGVTIGIGYDCGYCTKQTFTKDWQNYLSQEAITSLKLCCGVKGISSKSFLPVLQFIKIPYEVATQVFYASTIPACARDARNIYPGIEKLPPDAQGAILSLVYNRGPLINNTDRRKEMKAMIPLIAKGDTEGIAAQLRSMKRLWDPKKQKGLIDRREYEAQLVENASFDFLPEEIVIV
jgi:hypothetical protein